MEYQSLGNTGIKVSRLCFGTLTIGPYQQNLSIKESLKVMERAVELGINFFDTAKIYETYPCLKELLLRTGKDLVVASKSYDYTAQGMAQSLEEARRALNRDYVDLFLLHEQESELTIEGHRPALEYLLTAKERGLVRAVGISTHSAQACAAAARMPEIDVIHPLLNRQGLGIIKGTLSDMLQAVELARLNQKGLYAMKALGGGNLLEERDAALKWALALPVNSVAVGMQRVEEVEYNVAMAEKREPDSGLKEKLTHYRRRLLIEDWCQGCGSCVERCAYGALTLVNGRAEVDPERCLLCSYCAAECPDFCIKVI